MNTFRILIVEDSPTVLEVLEEALAAEGHETRSAVTGQDAVSLLETHLFEAALVDIHLPDMTGIEVLEALKRRDPDIDVVMMTGDPQIDTAVQALRLGAYDYLTKPLELVALRHLMAGIVERRYLRSEVKSLRTRLAEGPPAGELIGNSAAIAEVRRMIAQVAQTDSAVLIEGESGTGKELIASAIHHLSTREKGPFVAVNCAAIPADLMESELFGHVKGAFSGASADSRGLIRSAERGTLFLDEIGELPTLMQPKLLRVLQESKVRPVGASRVHPVDFRVVAATNQNLEAAIEAGTFRQDLYFRLNVVAIHPPPLRKIKGDLAVLVTHFLRKLNRRFGRQVQGVTPGAMAALAAYAFPGNVRELENLLERAYALGAAERIGIDDLPSLSGAGSRVAGDGAHPRRLADLERELISETLASSGNNKDAAKVLGISERTLYRRMKRLGLN